MGNVVVRAGRARPFVRGIDEYNAVGFAALRRVGTEMAKESLVPVPRFTAAVKPDHILGSASTRGTRRAGA